MVKQSIISKNELSKALALVFSGAGVLGVGEVGAYAAIKELGFDIVELIGTSAGSIVACMIGLGYSPEDLKTIVMDANFEKLIPYNDFNYFLFMFRKYLANNKNVVKWLQKITKNAKARDLKIPVKTVTTNLLTGETQCFNSLTNPDMYVWEMIIPSMSIPEVFPNWKGIYADGGLADNLGINFLTNNPDRRKVALRMHQPLKVLTRKELTWFRKQKRYLNIMLATNERDMIILGNHEGVELVNLPNDGFDFLDRSMTKGQKLHLYESGYNAVKDYFTK